MSCAFCIVFVFHETNIATAYIWQDLPLTGVYCSIAACASGAQSLSGVLWARNRALYNKKWRHVFPILFRCQHCQRNQNLRVACHKDEMRNVLWHGGFWYLTGSPKNSIKLITKYLFFCIKMQITAHFFKKSFTCNINLYVISFYYTWCLRITCITLYYRFLIWK